MEETTTLEAATKAFETVAPASANFYTTATWVVGIVGFLFAVALFYLILILRDASYVSQKAKETSDTVNEYIKKPAGMILRVVSSVEGMSEIVMNQLSKFTKKKKGRSRKNDED